MIYSHRLREAEFFTGVKGDVYPIISPYISDAWQTRWKSFYSYHLVDSVTAELTLLSTGIIALPIFLHNVLLYYWEIIERLSIAFADNGKREIQAEAFLNMRKTA